MNYKIQFLDNEAFDSLPGVDMPSKIGVAYPETGEAFVRKTGSNVVDIFTAAHELEHLDGEALSEHYDPINHCYYKGNFFEELNPFDKTSTVGQFTQPFLSKPARLLPAVASLIPGIGPAVGAGIGAIQGGTTHLWGEPGLGSAIKGGITGFGEASGAQSLGKMFGFGGAEAGAGAASSQIYPGVQGLTQAGHGAIGNMTPMIAQGGGGMSAGLGTSLGGSSLLDAFSGGGEFGSASTPAMSSAGGGATSGASGSGISGNSIEKILNLSTPQQQPNVVQSPGNGGNFSGGNMNWPNMIGASGRGMSGGPGGAYGGQAGMARMKQMLQQQNQPGFAMQQGPLG